MDRFTFFRRQVFSGCFISKIVEIGRLFTVIQKNIKTGAVFFWNMVHFHFQWCFTRSGHPCIMAAVPLNELAVARGAPRPSHVVRPLTPCVWPPLVSYVQIALNSVSSAVRSPSCRPAGPPSSPSTNYRLCNARYRRRRRLLAASAAGISRPWETGAPLLTIW